MIGCPHPRPLMAPSPYSVLNPSNGQKIATISAANEKDVDLAVNAAQKAYDNSWGLKVPGFERGRLLGRLAGNGPFSS